MKVRLLPVIHSVDQSGMVPARKHIYGDAGSDEGSSEPQRQSIRLRGGNASRNLKLLQEEPEAGYDEAESH